MVRKSDLLSRGAKIPVKKAKKGKRNPLQIHLWVILLTKGGAKPLMLSKKKVKKSEKKAKKGVKAVKKFAKELQKRAT